MTLPDITIDRSLIQTEEELLARWGEYDKPLVSINCITYNHEKYIRDALDGFLIQKTDFPFEILVHDDASTDGTADIVREYEKRYPKIIKPIYQVENQYSQGKKVSLFNFERAQGEYIAMCEGDDYWFDPLKIHTQVSKMEKYFDINICIHPSVVYNGKKSFFRWKYSCVDKVFSINDVLKTSGQFSPTASYLIRKKIINQLPYLFKVAPVGDFFLEVFASLSAGILFIPGCYSVYRTNINGSWTDDNLKKISNESVLAYYKKMYESLLMLKKEIPHKYHVCLNVKIASVLYGISLYYLACSDYKRFKINIEKSFELSAEFSDFAKILYRIRFLGCIAKLLYVYKIKLYTNFL